MRMRSGVHGLLWGIGRYTLYCCAGARYMCGNSSRVPYGRTTRAVVTRDWNRPLVLAQGPTFIKTSLSAGTLGIGVRSQNVFSGPAFLWSCYLSTISVSLSGLIIAAILVTFIQL